MRRRAGLEATGEGLGQSRGTMGRGQSEETPCGRDLDGQGRVEALAGWELRAGGWPAEAEP